MKTLLIFLLLTVTFISNAQDLALARLDGKYGYINREGEMVIDNQFVNAASFSDGLAAVMKDDKWGFIDRTGEMVIAPLYSRVKRFDSGIAVVVKDEEWVYIDKEGNVITNFPQTDKLYDFVEGRAIIRRGDNVGIINNKGEVIVEPVYQEIKDYSDGYAKAQRYDRWGFIDKDGEVVVDLDYDDVGDYNGEAIWARKGEVFGIIKNNNFNPLKDVNRMWDFNDKGITYAQKGDLVGFINTDGEWIIIPQYDKARAFVNGLAPVYSDREWGYIDLEGNWVVEPKYRDAEVFSESGLAPVKVKRWGFINASGKMVISPEYDITAGGFGLFKFEEKGFIDGLSRVKTRKGWGYLDTEGNLLGDQWYENLELFK